MYPGERGPLVVLHDVTRQVLAAQHIHRALAEVETSCNELECLARATLKGNCKVATAQWRHAD